LLLIVFPAEHCEIGHQAASLPQYFIGLRNKCE